MPSRWSARRTRFRGILAGNRCVHPASVYDAISARIAEDLGFEVGMFSGSIGSMAVLGAPDLIVLTLTEFADQAYRICRAGNLPLLVDADHGYGNALNVQRTVEELETAGVCAMSIEDTVLPRALRPVGKAAADLRRGGRRQDEGGAGRRARTRTSSSPDAPARSASPASTTRSAAPRPTRRPGSTPSSWWASRPRSNSRPSLRRCAFPSSSAAAATLGDREYLGGKGVRVSLQGHQPFQASVLAIYETMKALRDGTPPADLKGLASRELMAKVTRSTDYARWTRDFLGGAGND